MFLIFEDWSRTELFALAGLVITLADLVVTIVVTLASFGIVIWRVKVARKCPPTRP